MYALTPLIALPLVSKPKLGLFLLFATLVATAAISFAIAWKNELKANMFAGIAGAAPAPGAGNEFNEAYVKPWFRAGPYLVGILTCYVTTNFKFNIDARRHWPWILLGWIVCLATWFFDMFSLTGDMGAPGFAAPYARLLFLLFCFSISFPALLLAGSPALAMQSISP
eukprot:m.377423 g.377423  ORF g.377423 m.377423 type:complete len:168 (-) comp56191_c0_seq68:392-895(-)